MTKQNAVVALAGAITAAVTAFLFLMLYDRGSAPTIVIEDAPAQTEIVVSVEGAVIDAGVYRLPADARLNDAIEAAGGFAPDADFGDINLAARLEDEQQIVIPSLDSIPNGSPASLVARPADWSGDPTLIDINAADTDQLDTLPGIGPVLAERIVAYRDANGPFTRVEELARVEGISPSMVDEMRDLITVGQ